MYWWGIWIFFEIRESEKMWIWKWIFGENSSVYICSFWKLWKGNYIELPCKLWVIPIYLYTFDTFLPFYSLCVLLFDRIEQATFFYLFRLVWHRLRFCFWKVTGTTEKVFNEQVSICWVTNFDKLEIYLLDG